MATTRAMVSARRRAHEARVRLQADRAERDRRIEEQVVAVLTAASDMAAAEEARAAAESVMARAAAALAGGGLSPVDIATLIEMPDKQVRQLIKDGQAEEAGGARPQPGSEDGSQAAGDPEVSVGAGEAERPVGAPSPVGRPVATGV